MNLPHLDARKHMDRRYECPQCKNANIIVHRDSLRFAMKYLCPNCKCEFITEPEELKAG